MLFYKDPSDDAENLMKELGPELIGLMTECNAEIGPVTTQQTKEYLEERKLPSSDTFMEENKVQSKEFGDEEEKTSRRGRRARVFNTNIKDKEGNNIDFMNPQIPNWRR